MMASAFAVLVILSAFLGAQCSGTCNNPTVVSHAYTTTEPLLSSETVFLVEFELSCESSLSLSALVDDGTTLMPVPRALGVNKYQLSWSMPHKSAKKGTHSIRFFDDEGAAVIRKALRYGDDPSSTAVPLFTIDFQHNGLNRGIWLAPPFIAAIISLLVWWLAHMTKTKLQE